MTHPFTLRYGLIACAVALAVAFGFETDWGDAFTAKPTASRPTAGKHDAASVLPDFRLSSEAGAYSQIAERPLLNPSRKPAPTQVVAAATEPPKPQIRRGLYSLIGITDLGSVKIAQMKEVSSGRVKSVKEGDVLQELTVKKIEPSRVTLAFQRDTDIVELPKFTASGKVPQPAPVPVAPPPPVAVAPAPVTPTPAPVVAQSDQAEQAARILEMRRNARAAGAPDPTDPAVIEERRQAFMAAREGRK